MLITTAIHLLVIGLNGSIDNATLDAYLGEKHVAHILQQNNRKMIQVLHSKLDMVKAQLEEMVTDFKSCE